MIRALTLLTLLTVPSLAWAADVDGDGYSESAGDCDDTAPAIHPGAAEKANGVDDDCDYVVDEGTNRYDDDADGWSENDGDCDDANPLSFPGAFEWADGGDNDCDGRVDEGTDVYDDDGDGFTDEGGDCDDTAKSIHPGAAEKADGIDQDCDGVVDDGTSAFDDDTDGWTEDAGDCHDGDVWTWPGAPEIGDGRDNDCDGTVDEGTDAYDDDGDGWSEADGDCDDADASAFPGGLEVADGADQDCDGAIDDGTAVYDDDGDGFADDEGDCDDADAWTYPGAPEALDGGDDDCDGLVDEGTEAFDDDGDGVTERDGDCDDWDADTHPGAVETGDLRDDDCDGVVDEGTELYDDDGDGFTEEEGDCDDADPQTWPGAFELTDERDNDCDGMPEQYVGWACSTSSPGGFGASALLVAALVLLRRVRTPRGRMSAGPLLGWLLATPAWAGLVTELPDDRASVRLLTCDGFQECAADARFVDAVEGPDGRPYLPAELVFAPEDAGAGVEIDQGAAFRAALQRAREAFAADDVPATSAALDEAERALRDWPVPVGNDELFALYVLRGATVSGGDDAWFLRQAAAVASASTEPPAFPVDDPAVEEAFLDERRKLLTGGEGTLVLGRATTDAVYLVDGVPVGAEARITLLPGLHRITASHPASVKTWRADVPVLPAREVAVTATFGVADDLPWVHDGLTSAFDALQAPAELSEILAAWCVRHGVQRVELLRVEEVERTRRDVDVEVSAADPRRPTAAAGDRIDHDGFPGTYEDHVLAAHETGASAHAPEPIRRLRVVYFDPRTHRFSTDPGSPALLLDVAPPPRLRLGLETGWVRFLGQHHAAVGLDGGWRLAGPLTVEVRASVARAEQPHLFTTTWVDRHLYHLSAGMGVSPGSRLAPFLAVAPEVWIPVALGARGELGAQARIRDDWTVRLVGTASITGSGRATGASLGLARVF